MENAKLTFLGTGTSLGIPIIGCNCPVCTSVNPCDKRFRAAALVEYCGLRILIDAGPDFRQQMLRAGVKRLDAILFTHNHMDHTGGLDDVRAFNYTELRCMEIYCEQSVLQTLKRVYTYAFDEHKYPGAPMWNVNLIDDSPFLVRHPDPSETLVWVHDIGYCIRHRDGSVTEAGGNSIRPAPRPNQFQTDNPKAALVIPIRGYHDKMPVLGFRFGNIAYITDMSSIPECEYEKLQGLEHVTLNTVGYKPHHSHFSLHEALDIAARIGARHTWLTHLSHSFPTHEVFSAQLRHLSPSNTSVLPAYDGLVIN